MREFSIVCLAVDRKEEPSKVGHRQENKEKSADLLKVLAHPTGNAKTAEGHPQHEEENNEKKG